VGLSIPDHAFEEGLDLRAEHQLGEALIDLMAPR
jgi:hypothetical protein